jgi:hypothetical protein
MACLLMPFCERYSALAKRSLAQNLRNKLIPVIPQGVFRNVSILLHRFDDRVNTLSCGGLRAKKLHLWLDLSSGEVPF